MSTIMFSDQSSVFFIYLSVRDPQAPRQVYRQKKMAKTKTTPRASIPTLVTTATKWLDKTNKFLANIDTALNIFNDQVSSIDNHHETTYKTFAKTYREAFADIWPKINNASVKILLQSIKDAELDELHCMSCLMSPETSQPMLVKEKWAVPTSDTILGSLVNQILEQKLPDKETCALISTIFSDLAEAHKHYANAARGITDIAGLISPEQLTLVLAAAVPPTLQLVLPPGQISPLSAPLPPPTTATTVAGRQEMIKYCKNMILPDPSANAFKECEECTPTRVLATAIFCILKKHLFNETTSRVEVATSFCITAAQLHKALTGIDYQSGPHPYKRKRKTTDTASTITKLQKTDTGPSPAPSTSGEISRKKAPATEASHESDTDQPKTRAITSEDTLSSDSSDPLPEVPFK